MLVALRSHPRFTHVDSRIFRIRYAGHCMACTTCADWCCQWGCDVDLKERDTILKHAEGLAKYVKAPPSKWFTTEVEEDAEYPSGAYVRTRRAGGACVFRNKEGRGCNIHRYALDTGLDYHAIKPTVCWVFPLTWDDGVIEPAEEALDELVCLGDGPTLYEMARDELKAAFGEELVLELDGIQRGRSRRRRGSGEQAPAPAL